MARYTTNFKNLIDLGIVTREQIEDIFKDYELSDFLTSEEIDVIEERGTWSKDKLAKKIVEHYYFREFGSESFGMFKHYAKIQMLEIMESKLPLIYSNSIKYNLLDNVDYTETLERTTTGESTSSGLGVNSDTPQGQINKNEILSGKYASSTGANESENSGTSQTSSDGREEYVKTTKGNSGVSATSQAMIKQYRDVIRAVNTEIVFELEPLFMGIY